MNRDGRSVLKQRLAVFFFIVIILWIGVLFYFSTRLPSESAKQASLAYNFLKRLDRIFDFSETQIYVKLRTTLNKLWFGNRRVNGVEFVRKSAHFGLYMFLGCFSFLFGIFYLRKMLAAVLLGLSLPALIASLDEYSQQFFQRGASLNDVMIDLSGATFGVLLSVVVYSLVVVITRLMKKRSQSEDVNTVS